MIKLLSILAFLFLALRICASGDQKTNLLFITVDDMHWDSIGAFGCPIQDITPNLDKLAAQGRRFERSHVTIAICQPTRAVWMTGRYPHRNGALGFDPIHKDVPCLPEALQAGGYYTAVIGKAKHVVPSRHAAFDLVVDMNQLGNGRGTDAYRRTIRRALTEAKVAEKPFFVMANAHDPHRPFAGSPQEKKTIEKKKWKDATEPTRVVKPKEAVVPDFLPDLPLVRRELAEYFTSVHRADQIVGVVLEELAASGAEKNTLVIFMSDHGMALPFSKTNCYYASTRTPCIVRWPGIVPADSWDSEHFISGIDVAPTLLEAAGLPNLDGVDGKSLVDLLNGKKEPSRNHVFTMINRTSGKKEYPMRAVQDADFLYIWNGWADGKTVFKNESQNGRTMKAMRQAGELDPKIQARVQDFLYRTVEELYDLNSDPACLNNLLKDPANAPGGRTSAMTKRLWHWMKRTNDPQRKLFESQVELALD